MVQLSKSLNMLVSVLTSIVFLLVSSVSAQTKCGDPPKLDKVKIKNVGADYILLIWDTPKGFTEQCHPGFKVCLTGEGESARTCSITNDTLWNSRYDTILLLTPCTEYNVSVATVYGDIDGKTSEETYLTFVTAPEMTQVKSTVSNHTAHLVWTTPNALSLSCATNFIVKNCRYPDESSMDCETKYTKSLPLNTTQTTVGGMDSCSANYLTVRLFGQNGYASASVVVIMDPDSEIPAPTDAKISYSASDEVTVDYYTGSNDCIVSYRACLSTGNEAELCLATQKTQGVTFRNLNLVPCSNYTLHFTALGVDNKVSKNITKTFLTGPVKPSNLSVSPGTNSALISWDITPSALQCGLIYDITWYGLSGARKLHATSSLHVSSFKIPGLDVNTKYFIEFFVRGRDGTTSGITTLEFYTKPNDNNSLQ